MKKVLSLSLSVLMLISAFSVFTINAYAAKTKDFKYEVNGKTVTITEYIGTAKDVVIPEKINGKKVTVLGDYMFLPDMGMSGKYSNVTSIVIPYGVKELGHWTFGSCKKLKKIYLPKTITFINACSFGGCSALKDVYFNGTKKDWKNIEELANMIGNNDAILEAKVHYNSPAPISLNKLTKGKKSFKASWTKASGIAGYQIQYSTSKSFSNKKSKTLSSSKTSFTAKSLKGGKKYYVRIRTYKKVSGKKYYSAWSASKTITPKK